MGISRIFKSLLESGKVDIQARCEILRKAVSGTMSKFFKARDRRTDEVVGLKVLDKERDRGIRGPFPRSGQAERGRNRRADAAPADCPHIPPRRHHAG